MAGRKDQARGGSSGGGSARERSSGVGAVRRCGVKGSETAMPPAIGTACGQQAWVPPPAWGARDGQRRQPHEGGQQHDGIEKAFHGFSMAQPAASTRCRRDSLSTMPVATDTFRLSTVPNIGMLTSRSQCSRVRRRMPSPSEPMTQASGPAASQW